MADLSRNNFFSFPLKMWDDDEGWSSLPVLGNNGLSVSEDEQNVYIEAALPGIDPKRIEITVDKGVLYIRGEAQETEDDKKKKYFRKATQSFSYRVTVPGEIDQNTEPVAESENGVMKITFKKVPQAQPKKITVKTK